MCKVSHFVSILCENRQEPQLHFLRTGYQTGMKNVLIQQAMEHQFSDYIARLGKEAGVGILVKELKPEEPGLEPVVGPEASAEKPGKKPEGKQGALSCAVERIPPARKRGWFFGIRLFI